MGCDIATLTLKPVEPPGRVPGQDNCLITEGYPHDFTQSSAPRHLPLQTAPPAVLRSPASHFQGYPARIGAFSTAIEVCAGEAPRLRQIDDVRSPAPGDNRYAKRADGHLPLNKPAGAIQACLLDPGYRSCCSCSVIFLRMLASQEHLEAWAKEELSVIMRAA
eukprot:2656842-Rhodomonas_salina.3